MKVVFFTEGGRDFGFGHVARCAALQEAFEEKGVASEFIVNADNTIDGMLRTVSHRKYDWLGEKEKALQAIGETDIVVIDSYYANLEFYREASKKARKTVYLDDNKRINYPKGVVVNSAIYAQEIDYPCDDENVYLLGIQYASLRKEFWDISERKKEKGARKILITFGGMDYSGLIQKIVSHFEDRAHYTFECIDFNREKIDSSSFLQLILESDLCLSGGGQTVYNLARCGLPTIGICLSDNQLLNLEKWNKTGFLKYVGRHEDGDLLGKIEVLLNDFDSNGSLSEGRIGQKYVDGQGARRVVQAVLSGSV